MVRDLELIDKEKLVDTLMQMNRGALASGHNESDPDQATKIYAQAHAFQMISDMAIAGMFDLNPGGVTN